MQKNDLILKLIAGNKNYINGSRTQGLQKYSHKSQAIIAGQQPKIAVIACSDSRVPVESIFDCAEGELFVMRIAGNYLNKDIAESILFAVNILKVELILVLAHSNCGAVNFTIDTIKSKQQPKLLYSAFNAIRQSLQGLNLNEVSNKQACGIHALETADKIKALDFIDNNIAVHSAIFQFKTGAVEFLD